MQAETEVLAVAAPVVVMPAGHAVHVEAPAADAYVPARHAEQPAAQLVPLSDTEPKNPGAHIVQAETYRKPACEPVVVTPAGQAEQPAAIVVPGFVTEPKKPGAQMVQAATDVLPVASPAVVTPDGHAVQAPAPADEYVPAAQAMQLGEPAGAYVPSAHIEQPLAPYVPGLNTEVPE